MGLRFRKSVTLFPGVKMNFGKTGVSVSTGIPGFRKTFHSSGRTTTSVGIPGTGLYYSTTDNSQNSRRQANNTSSSDQYSQSTHNESTTYQNDYLSDVETTTPTAKESIHPTTFPEIVSMDSIKDIHKKCDDAVDWTEVLVNPDPIDDMYNKELWHYYHSIAADVLSGNIDSYLKVIQDINPYNDLLNYGSGYEFGTDESNKMEVEFQVKSNEIMPMRSSLSTNEFFDLLQDYVCSCTIRVARDTFALLPVQKVLINAVDSDSIIISVEFDRMTMDSIKFNFTDPSDIIDKFKHNMDFTLSEGFKPVDRL